MYGRMVWVVDKLREINYNPLITKLHNSPLSNYCQQNVTVYHQRLHTPHTGVLKYLPLWSVWIRATKKLHTPRRSTSCVDEIARDTPTINNGVFKTPDGSRTTLGLELTRKEATLKIETSPINVERHNLVQSTHLLFLATGLTCAYKKINPLVSDKLIHGPLINEARPSILRAREKRWLQESAGSDRWRLEAVRRLESSHSSPSYQVL